MSYDPKAMSGKVHDLHRHAGGAALAQAGGDLDRHPLRYPSLRRRRIRCATDSSPAKKGPE